MRRGLDGEAVRFVGLWFVATVFVTGCVSASIVRVNSLAPEGKPISVDPGATPASWKEAVRSDLAHLDKSGDTVVYPDSDVLSAIGGGILTVAYFGHDMGQKTLDQTIPEGWTEQGVSLDSACGPAPAGETPAAVPAPSPAPIDVNYSKYHIGNPPEPDYVKTWTPFPVDPSAPLPHGAACDAVGNVPPALSKTAFCGFGRLALQPGKHPLVIVLHGLFDSSNQNYVRQVGAIIYSLGYSVLLMDLRDHGDTFRRNKDLGWGLGDYEGADIVRVANDLSKDVSSCQARVSQVGAIGFSGGGLATVWARIRGGAALSLGAVAVNPPLDLDYVLERATAGASRHQCSIPRAINVTWPFYPVTGIAFGGIGAGAGALAASDGDRGKGALIGAGIGAAAGLLALGALDLWGDGTPLGEPSNNCVATTAIFNHFADLMETRWRTLWNTEVADRSAIFFGYVDKRTRPYAALKPPPRKATVELLHSEYDKNLAPGAHLLVISSEDDPVVGVDPVRRLGELFAAAPDVQVVIPKRGGHAAEVMSNQAYTRKALYDFWRAGEQPSTVRPASAVPMGEPQVPPVAQ